MDVPQLRVLRAVVADGSIRGAAASLGYTPSAVSQRLAALQKELGLPLYRKAGRGIEATSAGRAVAMEAGRVFEALADLQSLVVDLRDGRTGTLSIGYFASAGATWLPPVVAAVKREFPGLRLDLRLIGSGRSEATALDLEVTVDGAGRTQREGYHTRRLVTEPYLAVVSVTSPLAIRPHVDLVELRDQPWIDNDAVDGPCRRRVLAACSTVGFSPSFQIEAQDYPSAIGFVAEGMGITVVPRLGVGALPEGTVAVRIVNPTPHRTISVCIRESVRRHPAVARALTLLEMHAAGRPAQRQWPSRLEPGSDPVLHLAES